MTESEAIKHIAECASTFETKHAAAKKWKISPQYLTDVLNLRRKPGAKILRAVKLRRVEMYEDLG